MDDKKWGSEGCNEEWRPVPLHGLRQNANFYPILEARSQLHEAATLHRMEPRHAERLTNAGRVNVSGRTSNGERRLSLSLQLFLQLQPWVVGLTLLNCSQICLKKTHLLTHFKIPFLPSTSLGIQCLPSNESFPPGAKISGTRSILRTWNKSWKPSKKR